jgi:S1-C subfamily serine protease
MIMSKTVSRELKRTPLPRGGNMQPVTVLLVIVTLSPIAWAQAATQPTTRPAVGFLGAQLRNVDDRVADARGLNVDWGVLVAQLVPEGPAEQAGVEEDDVIQKANGRTVRSLPEFQDVLRTTRPGQELTLLVVRGEAIKEIKVTLAARPAPQTQPG